MPFNLKIPGLLCCLGLAISVAHAEDNTLKVCAAEDEMPYSNRKGEGFENKLAQWLGSELHKKVTFVYWTDPRYYLRDTLDKGLCDVVIGVDTDDPRVATTAAYYRSGYVFIARQSDQLDLSNWHSEALTKAQRIAFVPGSPAETMLRAIGRYNDLFNYSQELVGFRSKRNQYIKYEAEKLVDEVSSGHAELAVLWGPSAGRYVKASVTPLTMTVIPDNNTRADGAKVPHHYSTSMAVRKGDTALLAQLDGLIKTHPQDIKQLLMAEGIPLLTEQGFAVVP
ncbi:methanol oxidation system protein MoxJ [Methylovulum psychrotolerans]|uniref:Methanol oxidation system protein MoxJ n=1 Tax=Methylovulum psychrotolerans TaxID=1704499 RepID=A0A2S5CS28_9GAMM|nr:methanol oxidation system protein MoxJ [Methylovulum psychrotolerans]POZ53630.1 methanol oxidation system protein MoxJ [Methylovulum psychrotolerans]